jgi:triacylglycerol lipase
MKAKHIVFVHGLFGWGLGELGGLPYWGDALEQFHPAFATHEAKCGPLSSFHDRACEVFAQTRGGRVEYGAAHSAAAGHAPFSRRYEKGFVPDWSADNPIILVGHSAGAQTCLQLQSLLAQDFWGVGTSADWVEAVVSVAGVVNGSLLTYMFCDKVTGVLKEKPSMLIGQALNILSVVAAQPSPLPKPFDLYLDQWTSVSRSSLDETLSRLDETAFVGGEDNLAYDLTLQGCLKANQKFKTHEYSFYFSLVTDATQEESFLRVPWFKKQWRPDVTINPILYRPSVYQAREVDFPSAPIPGWGEDDFSIAKWRDNDGAVSVISQIYPFTARAEPVGGLGVFARGRELERGKWYYDYLERSIGHRFDHFDPVVGSYLKPIDLTLREAQRTIYHRLSETLQRL